MSKLILGSDEAGRGPVIGPLVIAAVVIDSSKEENLKNIGVKDSKLLSPLQRERMFDSICDISHSFKIMKISPKDIDSAVLSKTTNLNWLEADASIEIINELKPEKAILDCPSINLKAYEQYIKAKLKSNVELLVEHKADFNHAVVAAASILAKVTRDQEIEKIKKDVKTDFGSGYPSDPRTQAFLKDHYKDHSQIFRKSWSSYTKAASKSKQKSLAGY